MGYCLFFQFMSVVCGKNIFVLSMRVLYNCLILSKHPVVQFGQKHNKQQMLF